MLDFSNTEERLRKIKVGGHVCKAKRLLQEVTRTPVTLLSGFLGSGGVEKLAFWRCGARVRQDLSVEAHLGEPGGCESEAEFDAPAPLVFYELLPRAGSRGE